MTSTLNEYTAKLINTILFANSQDEVKQFIDAAMLTLEKNNVNGHIIGRFLDKMLGELEMFNPMDKNAKQWSNISTARILLNRIKHKHNTTAG